MILHLKPKYSDNLKEWNMFQICSCHLISIFFFGSDKHPHLDWSI